mgnify:CR=1 FL=1
MWRLLSFLLLLFLFSFPAAALDEKQALKDSQAAIGRTVSDYRFTDSGGRELRLSELRGKPLVVSFCGDQFDQTNKDKAKLVFDAFAGGNPLRFTDPTGYFTEDEIMKYMGVQTWDDVLAQLPDLVNRQTDGSVIAERVPDAKPSPAPHQIPRGHVEVRRVEVEVQPDRPDCPVCRVDLSLVRDDEGGQRVIASSPTGSILRALDVPILPGN